MTAVTVDQKHIPSPMHGPSRRLPFFRGGPPAPPSLPLPVCCVLTSLLARPGPAGLLTGMFASLAACRPRIACLPSSPVCVRLGLLSQLGTCLDLSTPTMPGHARPSIPLPAMVW